ncbi:COPII coat Sec23p-Sfb3p heterodimer component [Maublancomyces gigas]|uniref:COPII coat Sec23p-Sfb3p heterodimer component n=1 Tax=Discina gigas TaxID=1032678 RepID=A0ABR3G872_9PEZI
MAEMAMYHALGADEPDVYQEQQQQPPHQNPQQQQQFRPAVAPPPTGYQQTGANPYAPPSPYGHAPPPSPYQQPQGPYGQAPPPPPGTSPYQPAYGAPPPQSSPYGPPGGVGELSNAMSGMGIAGGVGATPGTTSKASRKKARAFHDLDQAPDSGPSGNLPPYSPGITSHMPSQFLGQQQPMPSPGLGGSSQFPVAANQPYIPPSGTNPAAFAARPNQSSAVQQSGGKIDPNSIPSIPLSRDYATAHYRTEVYQTLAKQATPNANSDFIAQDQGNASPRFCRLTLNSIPATADLLASTALPLALLIQPLAKQKEEEEPIPVLDFGEMGPPRCRRCRTYINPFMTFVQGGGRFQCNMCLFPNNEVAPEYYSPVDMAGSRVDRNQRPELIKGTVEFVVPKEYWAKKEGEGAGGEEGKGGSPMRWLFLVDVGENAVNKGVLESVVGGIREALYGESAYVPCLDGQESEDEKEGKRRRLPKGCKIGICTFDKEVQFYNLNPNLDQAQMLVMTDIEDPFVPLNEGLFVDPYESRTVIESLLTALPELFLNIKNPEPALLPALSAALSALEKTGGKIICSLATLPTWGPNRLFLREDSKLYNTDKEKALFQTEHPAWRKIAGKMVEAGVGVDFFLTPSAYIDVATVGHIASTTGGETFFYPNFVATRDAFKLRSEFSHSFHRETGYQALMKVRCSNGLQVTSYHGNFLQHSHAGDVEFGTIDADKCISVMFSYDGKLDSKVDAHFQSALLYTTQEGERRVRCSNVVAAVTEQGRDAVRWADQDAVLGVLAREAASRMIERPLKGIRGALTEKCVEILAAYRKNFSASGNPPGQLVLPEGLKEFGMYVLALLKCRAFRGGNVASDMRVHSMRLLKSMGPGELQLYLYPKILPIHSMTEEDGFPDATGHLKIPASIRASYSFIEEGGCYLIENGQLLLLWIHNQVSPNLLSDLFGPEITSLNALDANLYELPLLETHLNAQVRNIMQYLKTQRGSKAISIQLARQGLDGAEYEFAGGLVEDRNNEERSYVDWLVHVHKFVQLEVSESVLSKVL